MIELVYVSAVWCAPCKRFRPVVEAFAAERGLPLRSVDVDTDAAQAAAIGGIRSVPTLVVYRDGVEVGRTGLTTAEGLAELVS